MARAVAEFDLATRAGFVEYVERERSDRNVTVLWWTEGSEFIGRLTIRHELRGWLETHGGHIGYEVRPSRRSQGHAQAMLVASLPLAHQHGIDPALVTCDFDNLASKAVIESTGAHYESRIDKKLRYWIPTTPP